MLDTSALYFKCHVSFKFCTFSNTMGIRTLDVMSYMIYFL